MANGSDLGLIDDGGSDLALLNDGGSDLALLNDGGSDLEIGGDAISAGMGSDVNLVASQGADTDVKVVSEERLGYQRVGHRSI